MSWRAGWLAFLFVAGCQGEPATAPPPPAYAQAIADWATSITLMTYSNSINLSITDQGLHFVALLAYRVPATTTLKDVTDYYGSVVKSPWQPLFDKPQGSAADYTLMAWHSGKQTLAAALVENPVPGKQTNYRVLLYVMSRPR